MQDGVTCSGLHSQDGWPVDVSDAARFGDGCLDDGVTDDAPDPVELVLLGRRVGDAQVGHSHPNRPVLHRARVERTARVDRHSDLEKKTGRKIKFRCVFAYFGKIICSSTAILLFEGADTFF